MSREPKRTGYERWRSSPSRSFHADLRSVFAPLLPLPASLRPVAIPAATVYHSTGRVSLDLFQEPSHVLDPRSQPVRTPLSDPPPDVANGCRRGGPYRRRAAALAVLGGRTERPDQPLGLPLVLRRFHEAGQDEPRPVRRGLCQAGAEIDRADRPRPVADPEKAQPDLRDDQQPLDPQGLQSRRESRGVHRQGQKGHRRLRPPPDFPT